MEYELEIAALRNAVWINASDGSTVGRFGRFGIDLHNTITEQLNGMSQCRHCTRGKVTAGDWDLFREKALEWWGIEIPPDAFDASLFK